ncbi:hypothetical protein ZWY2020_002634 [Hordeum vulgare]|nr:hypothetical protein ZWY2020_002634 [Hordeum vulgare]
MVPSKVFMLRLRSRSRLRRPSSDGMPPLKLLFDSCSLVREVRLVMHGDMEPEMPSDSRSSAITRRGDSALQVIPCHSHTSKDVLLHEAKTPAGLESRDLKQRRDCLSFSVSSQMASGSGRQQKRAKRCRDQTKPGNKTPEDAIVIVCRRTAWQDDASNLCSHWIVPATPQQQHELMGMALPRSSLSLRSLLLLMSQRKPHRSSFFSSSAGPGPAAVVPAAPGTGTPAVQPPAAPAEEPSAHTPEDPKHPVLGGSCSTLQPVTCEPSPKTHPDDKVCKDSDLPVPRGPRNSSRDKPPRSSGGTSDIDGRDPVEL